MRSEKGLTGMEEGCNTMIAVVGTHYLFLCYFIYLGGGYFILNEGNSLSHLFKIPLSLLLQVLIMIHTYRLMMPFFSTTDMPTLFFLVFHIKYYIILL